MRCHPSLTRSPERGLDHAVIAVAPTASRRSRRRSATPTSSRSTAGDRVRISGVLYTARDAAHGRLLPLMESGQPLPIDVRGQIIYYTGPSPARPGDVVGSDRAHHRRAHGQVHARLLALGLKGTIGKGHRSQAVKDALREHKGVYFGAIGGAGRRAVALREAARASWRTRTWAPKRSAGSSSRTSRPS